MWFSSLGVYSLSTASHQNQLQSFLTSLGADKLLKVEEDLGCGYVKLTTTEAERRQARYDICCLEDCVVELLRNARDARSKNLFIVFGSESSGHRRLVFIDDGDGIPKSLHKVVFEPRVTSRLKNLVEDCYGIHGRGMALFSISQWAEKFELLSSEPERGSIFELVVNVQKLPERVDQSTFPVLKKLDNGNIEIIKGPHNIWRTMVEFSLKYGDMDIYFGSAAQILSTLRQLGKRSLARGVKLKKLWLSATTPRTASELRLTAKEKLGIEVSARTSHRIINNEIPASNSIHQLIMEQLKKGTSSSSQIQQFSIGRMISPNDLETFAQAVREAFRNIEKKYFLHLEDGPKIVYRGKRISVTLTATDEEQP
jgi:predicted Rdx family selenoprotein